MKRIIFTIIYTIAVNGIIAQPWMMKIKQGSGTTYSDASTVDEITFVNTTTTPFVCGDVILYGGETYPTILIGSQCWFQKNLNIGARIDGSQQSTNNSIIEKKCFNDNDANCIAYGGLYQWNEAMQYITTEGAQGICPEGWHIPTDAEFTTLATLVNEDGNKLKALGQGYLSGPGTNTSGFSAMLGGWHNLGSYYFFDTLFWGSMQNGSDASKANCFHLSEQESLITYGNSVDKEWGLSVRCLKD